ncbi:putative MFS-type transporter PB1E7.08c [Lasiodiplodia hormozganensis]|uniref:MFS-type transporter PB1E7.08c n=1 Tax=Lasiodiplodia hormozganensis TaxID=869390 RepID=A0AA39Z0I4_9PEZI|nr:putative MFS-type transporter PB1E7.08c [Lasiodiplodia hormozganensis]
MSESSYHDEREDEAQQPLVVARSPAINEPLDPDDASIPSMYLHTTDDKDPSLQPLMADFDYKSAGGFQPERLSGDAVDVTRSTSLTEALHAEGLSLFEKKCVLINREIDAMGMGKYQWYVWCMCGFGYFLDLLWANAFGLVLGPVQQEFGFGNDQSGNISTSFSAGLTAGAFVWGVLADIVGRQWAFNLTVLIASIFGICLGAPNSYSPFLVLTAFTGFGIGGNIPIDTTITLEFIPQNKRFLLALLSIFQPLGVVICSALAYAYIPAHSCTPNFADSNPLPSCRNSAPGTECCSKSNNMGWRYLMYTLGAMTISLFFIRTIIFRMKESPKYLVYRGRDEEAVQVIHHIAKINGHNSRLRLESFEQLESEHDQFSGTTGLGAGKSQRDLSLGKKVGLELERYKLLFSSWEMTRLTILVWLTYIMDYWGFTVAGTYLPKIIAIKNGSLNLSLNFTYRSYLLIYFPGVFGVALGALLYNVPHVGRKWTMAVSAGLMGASIFIFASVNSEASNIGLNAMEYFFQSMFNAVLYGWTPEAFPAPVRGTACGIASFWGRLFSIISPLIAQSLYAKGESGDGDINAVLYLAGGVTLGCVLSVALLPNRKLGTQSM